MPSVSFPLSRPPRRLTQYAFLRGYRGRAQFAATVLPVAGMLAAYPVLASGEIMQLVLAAGLIVICTTVLALLAVPRFHDVGLSGWYTLLLLIPGLNILVLGALLIWPGRPSGRWQQEVKKVAYPLHSTQQVQSAT
ncbi:DUF805 domain-containing protein [Hymenobacter sp. AT01-02]|uniref:DUF805 domain-containing protein n=1 Tax=Hymenobacter sp. AT01-02 TaxID=1571877 RepID=UPI0009EB76AD|nr:DUF805 domain-containing protein [Hymenobacter sp. AT01-02]